MRMMKILIAMTKKISQSSLMWRWRWTQVMMKIMTCIKTIHHLLTY